MNRCRYCKEPWIKSESGWIVCKCENAQIEWKIYIEIQHHKKILQELSKKLSDLKDSALHSKQNKEVKK